jgi:hypothetical protein
LRIYGRDVHVRYGLTTGALVYLAVVLFTALPMATQSRNEIKAAQSHPKDPHRMKPNADYKWTTILTDEVIPAKPSTGLWTCAYDFIKGPMLLKFEVKPTEQEWNYSFGTSCTADGDPGSMLSSTGCLMPKAPVGALIVKIGGSTASAADGKLVALVGTYAIVEVPAGAYGPLYLTINDEPSGITNNDGSVKVDISQCQMPTEAEAAGSALGAAAGAQQASP